MSKLAFRSSTKVMVDPFLCKQLVCHSSSHASVVASDCMEVWPCRAQLASHTSMQSDATTDAWEEKRDTSCLFSLFMCIFSLFLKEKDSIARKKLIWPVKSIQAPFAVTNTQHLLGCIRIKNSKGFDRALKGSLFIELITRWNNYEPSCLLLTPIHTS